MRNRWSMTSFGSSRSALWSNWLVIYCSVFLILLAAVCAKENSTYLSRGSHTWLTWVKEILLHIVYKSGMVLSHESYIRKVTLLTSPQRLWLHSWITDQDRTKDPRLRPQRGCWLRLSTVLDLHSRRTYLGKSNRKLRRFFASLKPFLCPYHFPSEK